MMQILIDCYGYGIDKQIQLYTRPPLPYFSFVQTTKVSSLLIFLTNASFVYISK